MMIQKGKDQASQMKVDDNFFAFNHVQDRPKINALWLLCLRINIWI